MFSRKSLLLIWPFFFFLILGNSVAQELQAVNTMELQKLIKEKKFVVAMFCLSNNIERCEEFEGELGSIREDLIDALDGDGWVVKLHDCSLVEEFFVGKIVQPVIVMFRSGLPVIYDGKLAIRCFV